MSGRLPLLSVKLEMLKTVSFTLLTFMAGYFPLQIAFALSFYILVKRNADEEEDRIFGNPYICHVRQ
jgi:hypothetical protein